MGTEKQENSLTASFGGALVFVSTVDVFVDIVSFVI
jgi:hypothetical protein